MKVVFFGSNWYTVPVVKTLINHHLILVVTTETTGTLIDFCKANSIPVLSTHLKDVESVENIKSLNADVAILASYGAFIPKGIINSFKEGIINIHPSLLPRWKGPSPIQYTLLNGDTQTGVSLIRLDNEIDHGPILSQKPYALNGNETSEDLLSILFEIGAEMVDEQLIILEDGRLLIETPQDHSKETWSYKITKENGKIELDQSPEPDALKNMIHAYYPWPGVWLIASLKGQERRIKLLPDGKIHVEGKTPVNYKDFVNGFGEEGKEILTKLQLT